MDDDIGAGRAPEESPWSFDPKDYRDLSSMTAAGDRLISHTARRLDDLIGVIEWLKTDCLKKGSMKHVEQMEGLSTLVEKTSKKMESLSNREGSDPGKAGVKEEISARCLNQDRELYGLLRQIEERVQRMTEAGMVPDEKDIDDIRTALGLAQEMAEDREALLKDI
jgi:hypothetical protein